MQRQQQQQQYPNNHYESSENNQTELHRFGQNADRFTTSGGTNNTTVRSDFFFQFLVVGQRAASSKNLFDVTYCQAVVEQLSGSCQTVVRQSLELSSLVD